MRSYGQYCGVARALDVVGDRWSLLIVRELLVRPCRFTDLLDGLPGVARNLLTDRLRSLQDAGIVARDGDRYTLTPRGRGLQGVLRELVRWSTPLMVVGQGEDVARGHWLGHAAEALYEGADLGGLAGLRIGLEAEGEAVTLEVGGDGVLHSTLEAAEGPDAVLRGSVEGVIARLTGAPSEQPAEVVGDDERLAELTGRLALGLS